MKAVIKNIEDIGSDVKIAVVFLKNDGEEVLQTNLIIPETVYFTLTREDLKTLFVSGLLIMILEVL